MVGLIASVRQVVPQFTVRAGAQAQTPVYGIYGALLMLAIDES